MFLTFKILILNLNMFAKLNFQQPLLQFSV